MVDEPGELLGLRADRSPRDPPCPAGSVILGNRLLVTNSLYRSRTR